MLENNEEPKTSKALLGAIAIIIILAVSLGYTLYGQRSLRSHAVVTKANAPVTIVPKMVYAEVIGYGKGRAVVRHNEMNTYSNFTSHLPAGTLIGGYEDQQGNFWDLKDRNAVYIKN